MSDEATVTLYAAHTAEGLAKACRRHAESWQQPCTVGFYFCCPLDHLGNGRCGKVEAKDWEAVMEDVEVEEEDHGR